MKDENFKPELSDFNRDSFLFLKLKLYSHAWLYMNSCFFMMIIMHSVNVCNGCSDATSYLVTWQHCDLPAENSLVGCGKSFRYK